MLTTFGYNFLMGMPKGMSGNPAGRPVGAVNKSTAAARTAIAKFVDGNADKLLEWLEQIANGVKDPKNEDKWLKYPDADAAFKAYMSVVEYHIPKLQRQEISGLNGGAIEVNVREHDREIMQKYLSRNKSKLEKDLTDDASSRSD